MGKIVITGTGRCGTSFLMHFFTELGLNTGYNVDECEQHLSRSGCDGGIEHVIGTELFDKSEVVKNPDWFYKPELLTFDINTIIIPIRSVIDVAASREKNGIGKYGGFWQGATNKNEQVNKDIVAFYKFMYFVSGVIPNVILLHFPKIVYDEEYLYYKLHDIMIDHQILRSPDRSIPYRWDRSFNEIAKPEKVHI